MPPEPLLLEKSVRARAVEFGLQLIADPEAGCEYQGTPHAFAFVRKQGDDGSLASARGDSDECCRQRLFPGTCPA